MKKAYLLAFEILPNKDYKQIHKGLDDVSEITDWWHFISNTYLIISELPIKDLGPRLREILKQNTHILIEVKLDQYEGLLPKQAWEWIVSRSKSLSPIALSDLLKGNV